MFNLPKECYVNRFIPKRMFYEKVGISSGVKEDFVNLVDRITWLYKISPDTIGISKTEAIDEVEIFQIEVKEKKIPLSIIKTITKGIPYKILFLIKYKEDYCYSIKVDEIYSSEWNELMEFEFNAINLEIMYENIVKSIIKEKDNEEKFENIINKRDTKFELEKKIKILKQKRKNEKQFNKKVEINNELNTLLTELEELNNE